MTNSPCAATISQWSGYVKYNIPDVKAEKKAHGDKGMEYVAPEDEGARFELDHHHLTKMGVGGNLKSGDTVHFQGHGTVERSETRSSPEGDRHSASVRFQNGSVDHEAKADKGAERSALRSDLENAHGKAEKA